MFENATPLHPVHLFEPRVECHYLPKKEKILSEKYLLPDFAFLHEGRPFASVYFGWNEEGITVQVRLKGEFNRAVYPDYLFGDAIELFIDTRDLKTSSGVTRFCHHFFFLPEAVEVEDEKVYAKEITHFRGEDRHDLASQILLHMDRQVKFRETIVTLRIAREALHGYDPAEYRKIGFTYRISRSGKSTQLFAVDDRDFAIEDHPNFWASLDLFRN